MEMTKAEALRLVSDLPDRFDPEELQYRLYLRGKLEAAEQDIRDGRTVSHDAVAREIASWASRT